MGLRGRRVMARCVGDGSVVEVVEWLLAAATGLGASVEAAIVVGRRDELLGRGTHRPRHQGRVVFSCLRLR